MGVKAADGMECIKGAGGSRMGGVREAETLRADWWVGGGAWTWEPESGIQRCGSERVLAE